MLSSNSIETILHYITYSITRIFGTSIRNCTSLPRERNMYDILGCTDLVNLSISFMFKYNNGTSCLFNHNHIRYLWAVGVIANNRYYSLLRYHLENFYGVYRVGGIVWGFCFARIRLQQSLMSCCVFDVFII